MAGRSPNASFAQRSASFLRICASAMAPKSKRCSPTMPRRPARAECRATWLSSRSGVGHPAPSALRTLAAAWPSSQRGLRDALVPCRPAIRLQVLWPTARRHCPHRPHPRARCRGEYRRVRDRGRAVPTPIPIPRTGSAGLSERTCPYVESGVHRDQLSGLPHLARTSERLREHGPLGGNQRQPRRRVRGRARAMGSPSRTTSRRR